MKKSSGSNRSRFWVASLSIAASLSFGSGAAVHAQPLAGQAPRLSAAALLEMHTSLTPQLAENAYHRPLVFQSTEGSNSLSSSVFAVLDSPFTTVSATFKKPDLWCEVLILHLNTKYCRAFSGSTKPATLEVSVGKKTPQPLSDTYALRFSHRLTADASNYLAVQLHANKGPLNTTDYQLELLAVPLPGDKTFINLRYSYGYGIASKLAMQTYLSTLGRGKVGFSKQSLDGNTGLVGGMLGAVERNTMRYYLAIEAYLASLKRPLPQQTNARFQYWFDATEEYPQQLREIDRSSYLMMKKQEYERQQAGSDVLR